MLKTLKTMTSDQKFSVFVAALICMALFGGLIGLLGRYEGYRLGVESMKLEAVQKGHAIYNSDDEGNPKWTWVERNK